MSGRAMRFRSLSHVFTVRCDDPELEEYVSRVLGRFAVPSEEEEADADAVPGASYELLDLGPDDPDSRYRLVIDGRWVLGSNDLSHVVDDLFSRVNLDTMETTTGSIAIHAGAVVTADGKGVLLPGPSGSGKTTLVAALVEAGFGYLSDEAAIIDPEDGRVHPYPKHLTLKVELQEGVSRTRPGRARNPVAPPPTATKHHVDPETLREGSMAGPAPVGFIVAYRFRPGAATERTAMSSAEAVAELGQNLMLPRRDLPAALGPLGRICRSAAGWRLVSGRLEEAVATVLDITGG